MDGLGRDCPDQDAPDAFADGGPRGLAPLALKFVAVGEFWECQVDSQVDGADQPKAHELAENRRVELDDPWRVVVGDLGPEVCEVDYHG